MVDDADTGTDLAEDATGTADDSVTTEAVAEGGPVETAEVTEPNEGAEGAEGGDAEGEAGSEDGARPAGDRLGQLEHEGEVAADYLEALLDILDLDGDLELDIEGDRASVAIVGAELDNLVGQRGQTLEALQELTRLAVLQETGQRSRLMLDIGGYRAKRRTELVRIATDAGERVVANGQDERLAPMTPFERKVVHDTIAGLDGVVSESEGEEPQRRVVVRPA